MGRQLAIAGFLLVTYLSVALAQDTSVEGAVRLGDASWRHGKTIFGAAISHDGQLLATASRKSVRVWDLKTGRFQSFPCEGNVFCGPGICFAPDNRLLGCVHGRNNAYVWDVHTGRELLRIKDQRNTSICAFSPDSKQFIASAEKGIHVWDIKTAKRVREWNTDIAYLLSPDLKSYVRIIEKNQNQNDPVFEIRDIETGRVKKTLNVAAARDGVRNGVVFDPVGWSLAIVHNNSEIQIREWQTGKIIGNFDLPKSVQRESSGRTYFEYRVFFSADAQELLLATVSGVAYRWDLVTGKELPALSKHFGNVTAVFKPADSKILITTGDDGIIRKWDAATGRELPGYDGYLGQTFAALSPDNRIAAVGDATGRLDLRDTTGKLQRNLRKDGPAITNLAFAPDGKSLAAGTSDGAIRFWETATGKATNTWTRSTPRSPWEFGTATTLLFSPDGRHLCVSDYPKVMHLYETATGQIVWDGKRDGRAAFSADGRKLATIRGRQLELLDSASGERLAARTLNIHANDRLGTFEDAIAWSPYGNLFIALENGDVVRCDGETGLEYSRFTAATQPVPDPTDPFQHLLDRQKRRVASIAVTPDGQWVVTGATDDTIRIWEAATNLELWRRELPEAGASRLAFGTRGRTLLSCGNAAHVYLWDLKPKSAKPRDLESLWNDLASSEGSVVFAAIWELSQRPDAVNFLRGKIVPAKAPDAQKLAQLLQDLGDPKFAVREKAQKELAQVADTAHAALAKAFAELPAGEARNRLARVLQTRNGPPAPMLLRQLRAVRSMSISNSKDAAKLLREWSNGAEGARLTIAARLALKGK